MVRQTFQRPKSSKGIADTKKKGEDEKKKTAKTFKGQAIRVETPEQFQARKTAEKAGQVRGQPTDQPAGLVQPPEEKGRLGQAFDLLREGPEKAETGLFARPVTASGLDESGQPVALESDPTVGQVAALSAGAVAPLGGLSATASTPTTVAKTLRKSQPVSAVQKAQAQASAGKWVKTSKGWQFGQSTNTFTAKKTNSFLQKLVTQYKRSPTTAVGHALGAAGLTTAIAGGIMAVVGTYPFAGFIKEEALQTIGFTAKQALDDGDLEAAREALDFQAEMLDPAIWQNMSSSIPYDNVIKNLDAYTEAARIQYNSQERRYAKLANKQAEEATANEEFERGQSRLDDFTSAAQEVERQRIERGRE